MAYANQLPASAKRLYKETRVGMGGGTLTAHAEWRCAFADIWDFLIVVNGTLEVVNNTVQRIVPLRFPDRPAQLLASRVDVRHTGYDHGANTYSDCIVAIDFSTPQFGISGGGAFMVQRLRFGGNFITIPGSAFQFISDGLKVNQEVGRFLPEVEYSVTMYQVPTFNAATVTNLVGSVNNATFMGNPAGTVLFNGASSEVQTSALFVQSYQVELNFSFRPVPWNYLMRPDGSAYAPVQDGAGNGIYTPTDLSPLQGF